jgi:hypothetical protein
MNRKSGPALLIGFIFLGIQAIGMTPAEYVKKYKDCAIEQMLVYNIPASITLAQGMLESQYGTSTLAVYANNHFGIKCHDDWTGPYYVYDDDVRDEHFRKYASVNESFKDHAEFLKSRPWYSFLFNYSRSDYHHWAIGLSKAGYATAPDYSQQLIFIIEENHLFDYDTVLRNLKGLGILYQNENKQKGSVTDFIIIKPGDCIYKIAREYNIDVATLCKNNGLSIHQILMPGQKIYLKERFSSTSRSNNNSQQPVERQDLSVLPKKISVSKG